MAVHTIDDLKQMQALPLSLKIRLTQSRIRTWVNEFGSDGVYVSFSGGKDSTVLLHIVRQMYPEVEAVFCDTGLEYPEIRDFVKTFDNVTWLKPKMNFRKVIETYGYPFISKDVSQAVYEVRRRIEKGLPLTTYKAKMLDGTALDKNGNLSIFNKQQWKFMLNADFSIAPNCCKIMKKNITKQYEDETDKKPILAQMACESMKRKFAWLNTGCNAFNSKRQQSNPMAFWTEQDVLQYIKKFNLPICSVYGEIVEDDELVGQMTWSEFNPNIKAPNLKTTGMDRTGCMFCGYGCHLEKEGEGRFERMKVTHPKQYEWIMKPWKDGGLGYKEVIDWINEHGNLNIRY